MEWNPVCIFDAEPDWKRLGALHPDACLIGFQHRTRNLWALDGGIDDLPAEFRYMFPLSWSVDFDIPEGLSIPTSHTDFLEKAGTAGLKAHILVPGHLRYGLAVAALAGVRTYIYPGICDPSFNLAYVLNPSEVEGFGVAGSSVELEWTDGNITARRTACTETAGTELDNEIFERLRELPYVTVLPQSTNEATSSGKWPLALWPSVWGDPGTIAGIGQGEEWVHWFREWKYCYERPSQNAPGIFAEMFRFVFGRRFSTTRLGRRHRSRPVGDSSEDD